MKALTTKPDLVVQVQQAIIDAIVSGELLGGERLTQEELADRLGVSRQPILQALVLLRDQGLIKDAPNRRGLIVAPLNAAFIRNLYELRSALDGAAAAAAARKADKIDRERGMKLLRQGNEAVLQRHSRLLVQADHAFHRFIYEASGNSLLIDSGARHWPHVRRAMATHLDHVESLERVWLEHEAILAAVLSGSARQAEKLSRSHAEKSLKLILSQIPDQPDSPAAVAA